MTLVDNIFCISVSKPPSYQNEINLLPQIVLLLHLLHVFPLPLKVKSFEYKVIKNNADNMHIKYFIIFLLK